MWLGYLRTDRLPDRAHTATVRDALRELAAHHHLGAGDVYIEVDGPDPQAAVVTELWAVHRALLLEDGAHLLVPSRAHLANLGQPGDGVVRLIRHNPRTQIYYVSPSHGGDGLHTDRTSLSATGDDHVLSESVVQAGLTCLPQLDVAEALLRRGWTAAVQPVDATCVALLADARQRTDLSAVIRLLHDHDGRLVLELDEPHHQRTELTPDLTTRATTRVSRSGRTITRCILPGRYPEPLASEMIPATTGSATL